MKGIYKITQKSTKKVYIGQSINIDNRWNQHAAAVDNLSFHEEYRKNPTDFTFEVLYQNDDYTKDDLNELEKKCIEDYHSNEKDKGFNGTAGNGQVKSISKQQMLRVRGSIDKLINSKYLRKTENKKILIIGNFNIGESSLYNNITVLTDDLDYTCETAKIIRVEGGDEIMAQLNMLKDEKFDMIIANPPYNAGNKIISKCVTVAKRTIALMPFSKYKKDELYKHVLSLELANPKDFPDAYITNNLCVCELIPEKIERKFEDLETETFDQKYREFYVLNQHLTRPYNDIYPVSFVSYDGTPGDRNRAYQNVVNRLKTIYNEKGDRVFIYTLRAVQNGTHAVDGEAPDITWNLKKQFFQSVFPIGDMGTKLKPALGITVFLLEFQSEKECTNFTRFFYAGGKDGLMNKLVKGLNKCTGVLLKAIPNIDWSVDRDYEHLTYEQLLEIMREELKKQSGKKLN